MSASVKLNVPIIKLDECGGGGDLEPMHGVSTIACTNEEHYLTYNHIDHSGGQAKCVCNSHETDVDCSNIGNCDLGHVNCGSGFYFYF